MYIARIKCIALCVITVGASIKGPFEKRAASLQRTVYSNNAIF